MKEQRIGQLQAVVRERLGVDVPDAETDLFAEGLLDSLVFVDLVMLLEEQFGLQVDLAEVDFEQFRTLSRIAALLPDSSTRLGAAAGSATPTR